MLSKIPIISSPLTGYDFLYAFIHNYDKFVSRKFSLALSSITQSKYIYLTNSGISSFYTILKILQKNSQRKEVILPAYTAGSLVVGIIKAGLKPVLCDVSLRDFNLDRDSLLKVISRDTLAVAAVHMFGIAIENIEQMRNQISTDIFLIEDCAQAMGSKIKERCVGRFGDISLFSFNRGKNLPLYGGGCIATNNKELAQAIEEEMKTLKEENLIFNALAPFKILAFCLALNPYVYGLGSAFISLFKDTAPPKGFNVNKMSNFQSSLGVAFMNKTEELFSARYQNGMHISNSLKDVKGIILPMIVDAAWTVFNSFPIIFENLDKRDKVEKELWKMGIASSRMYLRPLHHMFKLDYKKEDFPNAVYLAEHLLALPVHPLIRQKDLTRMIEIIRG